MEEIEDNFANSKSGYQFHLKSGMKMNNIIIYEGLLIRSE